MATSSAPHTTVAAPVRRWSILAPLLSLAALFGGAHPTIVSAAEAVQNEAVQDEAVQDEAPVPSEAVQPNGAPVPDRTATYIGGAAALLRRNATPSNGDELRKVVDVPGTLFVLMAYRGSPATARVYDDTPYLSTGAVTHPESEASNRQAAALAEDLTGDEVEILDFTSPPGGGLSTGLTYTIAYLDIWSDGAFTGGVRVGATGELRADGYVSPISAINEKTAAAHLAGVEVLFTSSAPSVETRSAYASRFEGELSRSRNTGATLSDERRWDRYEAWGASREAGTMDVIGVRHVGDVAAYLCGAGSDEACRVRSLLSDVVVADSAIQSPTAVGRGVGVDVR